MRISTNWPGRSATRGCCSRWWCGQRGDGESYEIVAGERRWRAAQRAGLHDVPVLIRELSATARRWKSRSSRISSAADLNALEEARAYAQLMEQFAYTQQQLADSVGKSRSHIANTLRLLQPAGSGARTYRSRAC